MSKLSDLNPGAKVVLGIGMIALAPLAGAIVIPMAATLTAVGVTAGAISTTAAIAAGTSAVTTATTLTAGIGATLAAKGASEF